MSKKIKSELTSVTCSRDTLKGIHRLSEEDRRKHVDTLDILVKKEIERRERKNADSPK